MTASDHQPRPAPAQWQWGEMERQVGARWQRDGWAACPGEEKAEISSRWRWSRSAGSPIGAALAVGQHGGWIMGVRDGQAAPDWGTKRNLTWQFAKDSEVWFCHCGKWQKTMDDPATIFVTIWLLYCFSFVQSALSRGHFLSLHLVLSLSFLTCSSAGNICLSYVYVRLKRWRLPRKLVLINHYWVQILTHTAEKEEIPTL